MNQCYWAGMKTIRSAGEKTNGHLDQINFPSTSSTHIDFYLQQSSTLQIANIFAKHSHSLGQISSVITQPYP